MRISRIVLKNYRQYRKCEIKFDKNKENDLHIIIGRGGIGKTNLLNAINWCLYGDEPHLSQRSSQLPLLNLNVIESSDDLQDQEVKVEVYVNFDDNRSALFSRQIIYRIYKQQKLDIVKQTEDFSVIIRNEKGNSEPYSGEKAKRYVEQFFPEKIREFFFFDGERLDSYFKEATGQNIRSTIFQISKLDLIERVEKKIDIINADLRKEAGKLNPKIEELRKMIDEKENDINELKDYYENCQKDIENVKIKIQEYREKLRSIPDVSSLEKQRNRLKEMEKNRRNDYSKKETEKYNIMFEYALTIYLWPVMKKVLELILQKRANKEIPPPVNKTILEETLNKKVCIICDRALNLSAEERIRDLLTEITHTTEISDKLLMIESIINNYKENLLDFETRMQEVTEELNSIKKEIEETIIKDINDIDNQIRGYNVEEIKLWYQHLRQYEEQLNQLNQQLGFLRDRRTNLENEMKNLKNDLDEELKKEEQLEKVRKEKQLCERILSILTNCKISIMESIRKEIEEYTRKYFFDLIWKKETFKDIILDGEYNVKLFHSLGYECLGSVSASERELLALSFTLALHNVSGFESPIIIDTPVARVSTEMRENFAKVFSEISKNKQIILLFTTSEFSPEVSKVLDPIASNRFKLVYGINEYETNLEEI
jgi:DNA sulfur modification protein DndD